MDQKIIIGVLVVIGIIGVIGVPMLYNATHSVPRQQPPLPRPLQQQPQTSPVPSPAPPLPPPSQPEPTPEPIVWEGTHEPPQRTDPQHSQGQQRQQSGGASSLNAETLVGSVWQVNSPHGPVTVEFGANGQGTATHQLVGTIPATWRVQGNKVFANASVMGQSVDIEADIQGDTLTADGQTIKRIR